MKGITVPRGTITNSTNFLTLYLHLTRLIRDIPFDSKTISLLHQYKRYKFTNTKISNSNSREFHEKICFYYINTLSHAIYKTDNESIKELLTIAYLKTVPTNKRFPNWLMKFVNLDKDDILKIFELKLWPHSHLIKEMANSSTTTVASKQSANAKSKAKESEIVKNLASQYDAYLGRQSKLKNSDMTIGKLILGEEKYGGGLDQGVLELIRSHPGYINKDQPAHQAAGQAQSQGQSQASAYNAILQPTIKTYKELIRTHPISDKYHLQEIKIKYSATAFGLPIAYKRQKNMVFAKIRYLKHLFYNELQPIAYEDLIRLERLVEGCYDMEIRKSQSEYQLNRVKKRVKNFIKNQYCFGMERESESESENERKVIYSKYRILKTTYHE